MPTVPTLLENRGGNFSDLRYSGGQANPHLRSRDNQSAATRRPFPENSFRGTRFDPVALAALDYFPLPNQPGTATDSNNFVGSSNQYTQPEYRRGTPGSSDSPHDDGDGALLH